MCVICVIEIFLSLALHTQISKCVKKKGGSYSKEDSDFWNKICEAMRMRCIWSWNVIKSKSASSLLLISLFFFFHDNWWICNEHGPDHSFLRRWSIAVEEKLIINFMQITFLLLITILTLTIKMCILSTGFSWLLLQLPAHMEIHWWELQWISIFFPLSLFGKCLAAILNFIPSAACLCEWEMCHYANKRCTC